MTYKKHIRTYLYKFLVFILLLNTIAVFAKKRNNENSDNYTQESQEEELPPKRKVSIKEYSTGTVYKELQPDATPTDKKTVTATNEDDPGFPGDPGQLPVGDGFVILLGAGFIYFLIRKNHFKKI